MMERTRNGVILALLLLLAAALLLFFTIRRQNRQLKYTQTFQIMGTIASHTFYGTREQVLAADRAARGAMEKVSACCNVYDPQSELSKLNAAAAQGPVVCSPELWAVLLDGRRAWEFTGGAFDITAKPLMDLWGFYRKREQLPVAADVLAARAKVGLGKVVFDDAARSVRFSVSGMAFDLGGISKGYAADRAAEAAVRCGVRSGVIDLGGNLRMLPEPPPNQTVYHVGLRDPKKRDRVLPQTVEVGNAALSTSGNYERFVELGGKKIGHIFDPVTGLPVVNSGAVTVIAPTACEADWLSTAVFLRGKTLADKAEREIPGVKVIFIP